MKRLAVLLIAGLSGCGSNLQPEAVRQPAKAKLEMRGTAESPVAVPVKHFMQFADSYGPGYFRLEGVWLSRLTRVGDSRSMSVTVESADERTLEGMALILPPTIAQQLSAAINADRRYRVNVDFAVFEDSPTTANVLRLELLNRSGEIKTVWTK